MSFGPVISFQAICRAFLLKKMLPTTSGPEAHNQIRRRPGIPRQSALVRLSLRAGVMNYQARPSRNRLCFCGRYRRHSPEIEPHENCFQESPHKAFTVLKPHYDILCYLVQALISDCYI